MRATTLHERAQLAAWMAARAWVWGTADVWAAHAQRCAREAA